MQIVHECNTLVTHKRPHIDEILAITLLKKFGKEMFPGIQEAKIVFWENGNQLPHGCSPEEYEKNEHALLIGIGGGRFDEHPVNGDSKDEECAATLVAKALGIDEDPTLEKILKFVLNSDVKGVKQPFDLAYLTDLLHREHPDEPERVIQWVFFALEAKYHEQLEFLTDTKNDFEKNAQIEQMNGPRGRTLKMATVVSDSELMSKFARSALGGNCAIVILKNTKGNVQIFTNKKYELILLDVIQIMRYEEQRAKKRLVTTDFKILGQEGKVEGAEEWFYQVNGQMLLNGSLTSSAKPTNLLLDRIKIFVRIGMNPDSFEPKRESRCKKGICSSTRNNPCPWFNWGLHRCRKIRFEMRKDRE